MFLKLMSFFCWGILLCLLLTFSLVTTLWLGWDILYAPLLWFFLIVATILMRTAWIYLWSLYVEGKITYRLSRYRLTRMERVLFAQWKEGRTVLRRIISRKNVIPWFILTGKRCGKTTLFSGTDLPVMAFRTENGVVVPTRTLRWSFFKTAAFLDLSSHFSLSSLVYERAWRHLIHWSRRQPPSGMVICISARELLSHDVMQLHLDAQQLRKQIEQLTRTLNRHLPLYVIITESDEIPGFSEWVAQLSAEQRQQVLGYHWDTPPVIDNKDPASLNELFDALRHGMELARIAMAPSLANHADVLAILDFPEKITQLKPALQQYLSALTQADAYFEAGMLGGVWFTSSQRLSTHSSVRQSLFTQELVRHHLPALSRYHHRILANTPYRLHHVMRRILMLICLLGLGSSAVLSADLIAWRPDKLDREAIVAQLEHNETWHEAPWRYLPFGPLLKLQHQWLERQLLQHIPHTSENVTRQLMAYQQLALNADAAQQNRLIMQLAQAIVTKKQLQQGMLLADARQLSDNSLGLRITGASVILSRETELAFERAQLSLFPATSPISAMQQVLRRLVQADSQWLWLYTTDNDLASVSAAEFGLKSGESGVLPGIWTRQGRDDIYARVALISQALGKPLPVLDVQLQRLPALRQEHWMRWLYALSRPEFEADSSQSRLSLLMSIDSNESPAIRLANRINRELMDISAAQAQPWLQELRFLQQQSEQINKMDLADQLLRKKTSQIFNIPDNKTQVIAVSSESISLWKEWRSSVRSAASVALAASDNSLSLVNGLFNQAEAPAVNPVRQMYNRFAQLRQSRKSDRDDFSVNTVWKLYEYDADFLLKNAINSAACGIQQHWQQQVLWPLTKNNQQQTPENQPTLAMTRIQDFMHNTGKGILDVTQGRARAVSFQGHGLPLTLGFLNLVNYILPPGDEQLTPLQQESQNQDSVARLSEQQKLLEAQKNELESQRWDISLDSQPATIPGKARLMPTGTSLTMICDDQTMTLSSMNFSEWGRFYWRPAHCRSVELKINFPGFDLNYNYQGEAAWPNFLRDFEQGEHVFNADDFVNQQTQLNALGITNILVRYQLSDTTPLQQAWEAWQLANTQLDEIKRQHALLDDAQPRLTGQLSLLPTTIAQCYP